MFSFKTYFIFLLYMLGAFLFKETHPFSRFPMYNQFPNWAYAFYLSDENKNLISSMNFDITGGWIGHTFYAICNEKNILYGDNVETQEELNQIGSKMLDIILAKNPDQVTNYSKIHLHKISYYFKEDSLVTTDKIIHARTVK